MEIDTSLIKVEGLHFGYRRHRPVLTNLDLDVTRGVTLLVGLNGAGKSTLFNLLLGELTPLAGTISMRGKPARTRNSARVKHSQIGYLPQTFGFPARVHTIDFVTYIGWLRGLPWADSARRSRDILRRIGLGREEAMPLGELSGGMLRRVGIAQAIVHDPDLVLLDEPMAGLDPAQRIEIRDLLVEEATRRSFLMATHILDDVERLANQVVILHDGRIAFAGSPAELEQAATRHRPGASAMEDAFLDLTAPRGGDLR